MEIEVIKILLRQPFYSISKNEKNITVSVDKELLFNVLYFKFLKKI